MKLKLMTILTAAILLLAAGSAMSVESSLNMDSTYGITGGQMQVGTKVTFFIKWTTGDSPPDLNILGSSNGFRVYSNDGATWDTLTHVPYWDLTDCLCVIPYFPGWDAPPYYNDNLFVNEYYGTPGQGADTVGFGGNSSFPSPGIPAGFSEFVYAISFTPQPGSENKTICIDSCFYPPGGEWVWSSDTGAFGEIKPAWNGPHCYPVSGASAVTERGDGLPSSFSLSQNYPNPFNPTTEINFDVPTRSQVTLSVFNVLGQKVSTLLDEVKDAGKYTADWDGTASDGTPVASGIYFYRMEAGNFVQTKKMMLLK